MRQQLVIAGDVEDPWGVSAYLHENGCADGLVLVGEVDERTLRMLYRRCSAFLSPSIAEGSGLSIVEAMCCGAPVLVGTTGATSSIMGDAGLLFDPSNPAEFAEHLGDLLSDVGLEADLRKRSLVRSSQFSWEPVVKAFLGRLGTDEACPDLGPDSGSTAAPRRSSPDRHLPGLPARWFDPSGPRIPDPDRVATSLRCRLLPRAGERVPPRQTARNVKCFRRPPVRPIRRDSQLPGGRLSFQRSGMSGIEARSAEQPTRPGLPA